MRTHTIVLVPSDHFYWLGLEEILRRQAEVRVVDVVRSTGALGPVVAHVVAHQPAFIVVAGDLEDAPLVALVADLRAYCPTSKVIAIGPILRHEEHRHLLALGLTSYLRWVEVSPERVRHLLALVCDADVRVGSGAVAEVLASADRRARPRERGLVLTERERAVMVGLAAGRTRAEIAAETHLGLRTVKRTIAALCARFDAPTLFVLGMKAVDYGFVPSGPQSWPERAT